MAKTKDELATKVLKRLQVVAANATPKASDSNDVISYYDSEWQLLRRRDLAFWSKDSIDDRVFNPLVDYISGKIAPDYGLARPDLQESGYRELLILVEERNGRRKHQEAEYY